VFVTLTPWEVRRRYADGFVVPKPFERAALCAALSAAARAAGLERAAASPAIPH
jgi:hypothetical protein